MTLSNNSTPNFDNTQSDTDVGDIPLHVVGPDDINLHHECPMCEISVDGVHYPQAILWEHKALQELLGVETEELLDWFRGEYKGRKYQVRVISIPD